jgi:sec-independent protein translocase protein TatB
MFEASFMELLVVFVVALVVLGPERLPKVARTLGLWLGRARGAFNAVKADVERELQLQEVREASREIQESLRRDKQAAEAEAKRIHDETVGEAGRTMAEAGASVRAAVKPEAKPEAAAVETVPPGPDVADAMAAAPADEATPAEAPATVSPEEPPRR